MSIIVTPSNPAPGQSVVFTLKYEGSPPPPTDVHVQVETPSGWDPVVGYDDIKSVTDETGGPIDPGKGFQLPIPPQNWSKPGTHRFRVQWTRKNAETGKQDIISIDNTYVSVALGAPQSSDKSWNWGDFFGRILGSLIAGAIFGIFYNLIVPPLTLICVMTSLGSGAVGGGLGYLFSYLFDAPIIRWHIRSALLFNLFFTLLLMTIFGLLAISVEQQIVEAQENAVSAVIVGIGLISGLLSSVLGGVLNNLRSDS